MKKKIKPPFPIYIVEDFQGPSTCDQGADCNPAENPSHHVRIDLTPEARAVIEELITGLGERHIDEIEARHHGDPGGASTCSYCKAIKGGRALLKFAGENQ